MKNSLLLMLIIGLFTVLSAQSVTVTAPNGGEVLTRGTPTTIAWTKTGFTENVKIELYKAGVLQNSIATSVTGSSFNWTVPNTIFGSDFKIKVTSINAAFINDYSDNNFTIYGGEINITTPNGGEVLQRGQSYNITWTDDLTENVKIELYQANALSSTIAASVPSNGTYSWQIPLNLNGSNFKIKISSINLVEINDISDNMFSILVGSISLISPNGGDVWELNSMHEIKWENNIENDPVIIELYKGGIVFDQIAINGGCTGSYFWTIPVELPATNNYKIKISSKAISSVFNISADFTIKGTLINGGNVSGVWLPDGSPYVITAKTNVLIGNNLEIKPGTSAVLFDTLKIIGSLQALGEQNNIEFINYMPLVIKNGSAKLQNCLFQSNKIWGKNFTTTVNSYANANSIVKTTDGGFAVAGYTRTGSNFNAWIIKLDANGSKSWDKLFNNTNISNSVNCVVQNTDGGYTMVGYTNSGSQQDVWVIKLDANGNKIWEKTFDGIGGRSDNANSIVQTSDGGYVIAGYTTIINANADSWVIKLDANGNKSWDKTFDGNAGLFDNTNCIVQTIDGGYAFAGFTGSTAGKSQRVTKLDKNGNAVWSKSFFGITDSDAKSIVQTTDGGYAVAGYTYNDGSSMYYASVIKLDANGNKIWDKTFYISNHNSANSIVQTNDNGYAITGRTYINGSNDIWLIKLDATGNKTWDKTFDGNAGDDIGNSLVQTYDGGYAITGSTSYNNSSYTDVWVIKLNSYGNLFNNKIIMQNANANSYLKNCLFSNSNKSAISLENSSPAITNCTFGKNNGGQGGAIYAKGTSSPKITNSIFWGNTATTGKQIYLNGTTAKPEFKYNLIEGGYTAIGLGNGAALGEIWEGNITTNPLITDTVDFKLNTASPAINAGTPDITALNLPAYDLWGNARVANDRIDIGAYEYSTSGINNNLINDWNLSQNYPNPFNPQTMINYTIKDGYSGIVKLKIFNAKGEVVQTIMNNVAKAGHYSQVFNGSRLSSGIYYYGIEAGDFKQMKKMVMVK